MTIVPHNMRGAGTAKGQTQALGCLAYYLHEYGRDTLITALQCITQTGDGNPGMLRSTFIKALCKVLSDAPEWRDAGEKLLRAMDSFEFSDVWEKAIAEHSYVLSPTVMTTVVEAIVAHLRRRSLFSSSRLRNAPPRKKSSRI